MNKSEEKIDISEDIEKLLEKILKEVESIGGIELVVMTTRGGILILSSKEKLETFSAMSATALGSIEHAFAELSKGLPNRIIAENSTCKIVIAGAGSKALLVIVANSNINLGMLLLTAEKTALKVRHILE